MLIFSGLRNQQLSLTRAVRDRMFFPHIGELLKGLVKLKILSKVQQRRTNISPPIKLCVLERTMTQTKISHLCTIIYTKLHTC